MNLTVQIEVFMQAPTAAVLCLCTFHMVQGILICHLYEPMC